MIAFSRQDATVFGLSFSIRAVFLLISAFFGILGTPFDTSATLTSYGCAAQDLHHESFAPGGLQQLSVWDSAFFTRIAQCGYEYEQFHAFFPLIPMLLRLLQHIGGGSVIANGLLFSLLSTSASCVILFRLTQQIYGDSQFAALTAILYCFNPASVFHSAVYTESCFALAFFLGLLILDHCSWVGATLLAVSTAARSNGIVGGCFVAHQGLSSLFMSPRISISGAARVILQTAACGALVALPLLGFQYFGYRQFCHDIETDPAWCATRLPYLYGHVQTSYWGVGFLRYYQLSQVPNFLLAAPVVVLSLAGSSNFVTQHGISAALKSVFMPGPQVQKSAAPKNHQILPLKAGIYVAHWAFLTAFATLFMHIQVATRLLSTCPPLYWYAAVLCRGKYRKIVWSYFLLYAALGHILFPHFYPWT